MNVGRDALAAEFGFSVSVAVEIADTDLGAVVYYASYARFLDRAVVAYRSHLGIPPLGPDGHQFVVRSLEIAYLRSARFGDELTVRVRTSHVGRSSHTVEYRIDDARDGAPVVTARHVIVGVSGYEAARPTRMPDAVRDAIVAFEGLAPEG